MTDAVKRVAGRAPDTSFLSLIVTKLDRQVNWKMNVGRWWEGRNGGGAFVSEGERVRVNNLVVEDDAVERSVNSVVDVVCMSALSSQPWVLVLTHNIGAFTFFSNRGRRWLKGASPSDDVGSKSERA